MFGLLTSYFSDLPNLKVWKQVPRKVMPNEKVIHNQRWEMAELWNVHLVVTLN